MVRKARKRGTGDAVLERAAEWAARLEAGNADEQLRADFDAWLNEAREHRRAFDSVRSVWDLAGALPEEECRQLRAEAYGLKPRFTGRRAREAVFAACIAAAIVVASAGIGLFRPILSGNGEDPAPQVFATAIGERSTVALADGSQAMLNTNTRLEVDFSRATRNVRLVSGQALFEVAKDKARPFVVTAGDRTITALGTEFDVRLDSEKVQVTLIEGRVSVGLSPTVRPEGATPDAAELTPGQQLVASGARQGTVRQARLEQVTSWREGRLIFEDEPLADAIAEVNRYSTTQLVLNDPALGVLRISGVFRTGQPKNFVQALTAYFPIRAMPSPSKDAILLTKRH